jgi:hypothetical protein
MTDTDWAPWEAAASLRDLGDLTARWLEGTLPSQPGYMPGCGPEPETLPLIGVLAAANRAGYLTGASQPGRGPERGYDGALWTQRAAVDGWIAADRAEGLADAATDGGLLVITHTVRRRGGRRERDWVDVTRHAGRVFTGFARQRTRADLRFQYEGCGASAIAAVCASVQLTLAAPGYGPDERVWRVLAAWAADHTTRKDVRA